MKVLFDWDLPELDMKYCFSRGVKLILFSFCTFLHLRPKFLESIYLETDEYAKTLVILNEMLGVETVFGVRDVVIEAKPEMYEYLKKNARDVRVHRHIGKYGKDRKRTWEPPLNQSMDTWDFEIKYHNGIIQPLKEGELPVFHVDRPYRFSTYIRFIHDNRNNTTKTHTKDL
jgi:hypothetical protein